MIWPPAEHVGFEMKDFENARSATVVSVTKAPAERAKLQ